MRTKMNVTLLIFVLISVTQVLAQSPITISTPKSSNVYAHTRPEILDDQDKIDLSAEMVRDYPNATEQNAPSATTTYNCHSFAWNMSEGGPTCTVAYYAGDTNESIYWTDNSYIETTEPYASKISYNADDHSAIQTTTQGMYISKWGDYPKMLHARDDGPAEYQMTSRKYYKLNPGINGTETALCENVERSFTSNTSISGSTYTWTRSTSLLDYVSGSGTTSYRVKANSNSGKGWLQLQITTPSGEVATTNYKYVWVGKPIINSVSGPIPAEGCPYTSYAFCVSPTMEPIAQATYTWSTSPSNSYIYPYYNDYCAAITFYAPHPGYRVRATVENSCGSSYSETSMFIGACKNFMLSPNPASENVTITKKVLSETNTLTNDIRQEDLNVIYTIRIIDLYGALHYSATKTGDSFTLPVNNLKNGTYIIQVIDGKNISNLQLIIKH